MQFFARIFAGGGIFVLSRHQTNKLHNMKKFLLFLMCIPIIGCSPVIYSGIYQMNLSKVEHPAENNLRYGETKIINLGNDSLQKYSYEDDVIK